MNIPTKPNINITIQNVLELACVIGGGVIIGTTSYQSSPADWKYFLNNLLGAGLIVLAVWLYHKESYYQTRAALIHGAFNAITEIYKRVAEQLEKMGDKEKVEILTNKINRVPEKIFGFLKDRIEKL